MEMWSKNKQNMRSNIMKKYFSILVSNSRV